MANRNGSPTKRSSNAAPAVEDNSVLGTALTTTRHIEAFSRKVTSTATTLITDPTGNQAYQTAMSELHKELRRPGLQRSVFSYAKASPTELVRSKLSRNEIQHRALAYLPEEILTNVPEDQNDYSLFQGFQATLPEEEGAEQGKKQRRQGRHKGQKLLEQGEAQDESTPVARTRREQALLNRRLEMMAIRKNMCSSEIREIDSKIANLDKMRKLVLDRLEDLEQEEVQLEQDLLDVDAKLAEELETEAEEAELAGTGTSTPKGDELGGKDTPEAEPSFMSASIYEKLPSPKSRRHKPTRRRSAAIRHEHFEPGSLIAEFEAHTDMITAIDFDAPFGTMVSSAFDDTVRVWDLNLSHCVGLLEGHHASVRCLQMDDSLVATGSMDASIRLWDLNQIEYTPRTSRLRRKTTIPEEPEDLDESETLPSLPDETSTHTPTPPPSQSSTADCHIHTLSAHVAEVTALHFRGDTLVSGSADKTLRQWDLVKGRCVQTLDVLWAAAQASASINPTNTSSSSSSSAAPTKVDANGMTGSFASWRNAGSRIPDPAADFVGALQCFDAALACGTADGMVRLWDLRSGQVHRSLVGHTGAITCLQFDEKVLVTGSADRSIRIWDLRTGSIRDAYAYDNPITSMMFDARRIVAAAGESVAKVYDKTDGYHWDCGNVDGSSVVERVRVRDGYLIDGRKDGVVGIWSC